MNNRERRHLNEDKYQELYETTFRRVLNYSKSILVYDFNKKDETKEWINQENDSDPFEMSPEHFILPLKAYKKANYIYNETLKRRQLGRDVPIQVINKYNKIRKNIEKGYNSLRCFANIPKIETDQNGYVTNEFEIYESVEELFRNRI